MNIDKKEEIVVFDNKTYRIVGLTFDEWKKQEVLRYKQQLIEEIEKEKAPGIDRYNQAINDIIYLIKNK